MAEDTDRMLSFVDEENPKSKSVGISDEAQPALEVIYGGAHVTKPADLINVAEFIGVKGYKAKGKRVTTYIVEKLRFVPQHFAPIPEPEERVSEENLPAEEIVEQSASEPAVEEVVVTSAEEPATIEEPTSAEPVEDDVELEIILPKDEDEDRHADSQQLNLF
jgi:topoisomerase-4 subunit A